MRRPANAQERIAARYIPEGFTIYRQDGDAIVYANSAKTRAIAYRGTSMKSEWNYILKPEQLDPTVEKFFENCRLSRKYKEERKAKRDRGETDTQKVKKALKQAGYPVISVTRGSGTAYNWINIVIDDYQSKIDSRGRMVNKYQDILQIAQVASGREHLHDDIQSDLFMVNISVNFTKYHKCSECVVTNCGNFHTPDSQTCGSFTNKEMADLHEKEYLAWKAEEDRKKAEQEAYEKTSEYLKAKQEAEDLRKAEEYAKECENNRESIGHPWIYDGEGNRNNICGFSSEPPKPGYAVKEIRLDIDKGKYFDSFTTANKYLISISHTFPSTGGYDKINFRVLFVDGEEYSGRLDCKAPSCSDNDLNLYRHILSFCEWYAGRAKNPYCGMDEYQKRLILLGDEQKKIYEQFIDDRLIPAWTFEHPRAEATGPGAIA